MLNAISPSTQIIIGSGINARILVLNHVMSTSMFSALLELKEATRAAKISSMSLAATPYVRKTCSSNTGRKNMSHTPVSP
jgi:hypothetical protein